jgi:hypothetical protein
VHRLHRECVVTLNPNATLYQTEDGVTHRVRASPSTYAGVLWYYRMCVPEGCYRENPDIKQGDATVTCIACLVEEGVHA